MKKQIFNFILFGSTIFYSEGDLAANTWESLNNNIIFNNSDGWALDDASGPWQGVSPASAPTNTSNTFNGTATIDTESTIANLSGAINTFHNTLAILNGKLDLSLGTNTFNGDIVISANGILDLSQGGVLATNTTKRIFIGSDGIHHGVLKLRTQTDGSVDITPPIELMGSLDVTTDPDKTITLARINVNSRDASLVLNLIGGNLIIKILDLRGNNSLFPNITVTEGIPLSKITIEKILFDEGSSFRACSTIKKYDKTI
jgi:hypothetical protein